MVEGDGSERQLGPVVAGQQLIPAPHAVLHGVVLLRMGVGDQYGLLQGWQRGANLGDGLQAVVQLPVIAIAIDGEEHTRLNLGEAVSHAANPEVGGATRPDGAKAGAYVEEDNTGPLNVYGRTKLAGEQAIASSGCSHIILRTSWVYDTRGKNFLRTVLRLAREREELRMVDDQYGAPTWARAIAEATAQIVARSVQQHDGSGWSI